MRAFIYEIIGFIYNLFYEFFYDINSFINTFTSRANTMGLSQENFNAWLDKTIISGDLITVGISWREIILYFLPIFLVFLCMVLFIRFFFKLLGLFRLD